MVFKTNLTQKQELFVHEFLIDLNASQAAIRAGYSKKTARKIGSENLSKPDIAAAIKAASDERIERTKIDADWVLREQVEVYKRCMTARPVLDRDGNPIGIYRFDSAGANRALETIGKHTSVNAFRDVGDTNAPLDTTWTVEIVYTSKEDYDRREKCTEHNP